MTAFSHYAILKLEDKGRKKKMYRIYGKQKTEKRFKALDLKNGVFVNNLMYASFFYENELEQLKKVVQDLNEQNEDFTFEIRKA